MYTGIARYRSRRIPEGVFHPDGRREDLRGTQPGAKQPALHSLCLRTPTIRQVGPSGCEVARKAAGRRELYHGTWQCRAERKQEVDWPGKGSGSNPCQTDGVRQHSQAPAVRTTLAAAEADYRGPPEIRRSNPPSAAPDGSLSDRLLPSRGGRRARHGSFLAAADFHGESRRNGACNHRHGGSRG